MNAKSIDMRFMLAIEGANDALWELDILSGRIHYSPRWSTSLGYTPDELGNTVEAWSRLIHPEDLPRVQQALEDHLNSIAPIYEAEIRVRARDGSYRWIYARGISARGDARDTSPKSACLQVLTITVA